MDSREIVDLIQRPGALPDGAALERHLVTHVSVLGFTADRVFKLKRPVDLGFIDARTLERRRHFSEEELRLNSRLSPELYSGLVALVRDADQARVVPEAELAPDAEVLTWGVEMKRLPEGSTLADRLERGEVDNALIDALARRIADFHASAERGPEVDACAG
ncbi:MAG: kinase, partial [Planctomycetota bacterium]